MAAFDGYMQRAFGHPIVGMDDELGGPAMWGARKFLQVRRAMEQRRALRGLDDDELGALMAAEQVGAEEMDELGAALSEDNDDDDDDLGAEAVGGRGKSLSELREDLRDLQAKLNKAESRLARTRFGPAKRIRQNKVNRLERKVARKKEQIQYLMDMQRAPGGGGRPADLSRSGGGVLPRGVTQLDAQGRVITLPRAGRQVSIPLLFGGNPYATASFAANAAANSSSAFSFTSAQITYARFYLIGIRVNAWLSSGTATATAYTASTVPISGQARIIISNLNADGYPNALYGNQVIALGGSLGTQSSREIVDGIRDNSLIQANNTITCSGSVSNPFELATAQIMQVSISIEALLNVIDDDLFGAAP